MSDEDFVKSRYPDARVTVYGPNRDGYHIETQTDFITVVLARTASDAWFNARLHLEEAEKLGLTYKAYKEAWWRT